MKPISSCLVLNRYQRVRIIQGDRIVVAVAIIACEGGFSLSAAGFGKLEVEVAAVRIATAVVIVEDVALSRHRPNQPYEEQVTLVEVGELVEVVVGSSASRQPHQP